MSKVIFINRYFYPDHSATSQLLSDLAFDLHELGIDVTVIACRQLYSDPDVMLPKRETINGVHVYRLWSTSFGRKKLIGRLTDYLTFYIILPFALFTTTVRGDVVVAKTDPPLISILALLVTKLRGAKLINWIQDIFPEIAVALGMKGQFSVIINTIKCFRDKSWKKADCNVVLGQLMADYVTAQGIDKNKVRISHNWSDGKLIQPVAVEYNSLRKEWGLDGKLVVGYSGNMGLGRDFSTIVNMAAKLHDNKDIIFLFIGGGGQREFIENESRKLGLHNIVFQPYQPRERLSESLSASDIHIISLQSEIEGFVVPSKFYGIAAVGRPTLYIGDPFGEIPVILRDNDCGVTISNGDEEHGIEFINQLYNDKKRKNDMGGKARRVFEEKYDRKIAVKFWFEMLSSHM